MFWHAWDKELIGKALKACLSMYWTLLLPCSFLSNIFCLKALAFFQRLWSCLIQTERTEKAVRLLFLRVLWNGKQTVKIRTYTFFSIFFFPSFQYPKSPLETTEVEKRSGKMYGCQAVGIHLNICALPVRGGGLRVGCFFFLLLSCRCCLASYSLIFPFADFVCIDSRCPSEEQIHFWVWHHQHACGFW